MIDCLQAKRAARKVAQRVRPQRPDSESPDDGQSETTSSIVQFNCAEVLDFSTGSVVLPLRITCYCRHHRERVGFRVHFTMSDNSGRLVGTGTTPPIMITDDHKSTGSGKQTLAVTSSSQEADWSGKTSSAKRKFSEPVETSKKRARGPTPPDSSAPVSRKSSSGSLDSPSAFTSALPTRPTSPSRYIGTGVSLFNANVAVPSALDGFQPQRSDFVTPPPAPPPVASPQGDPTLSDNFDLVLGIPTVDDFAAIQRAISPSAFLPTAPPSPAALPVQQSQELSASNVLSSVPFMYFHPDPPPMALPKPMIHRLIPSSGPTHGGIEVTILGSNFHPSMQLECTFGDVVASSTHRWSDNTLVCILPPRVCSGVVAVWFNGVQKEDDGTPPSLFTYTDESERAL